MAVHKDQQPLEPKPDLPLILLHRRPTINLPFNDLKTHFRILDHCDSPEPLNSFLKNHAGSVRALLCIFNCPVTSEILEVLPSLKLVVATSAGVDHIDLLECRRRGIIVTNASLAFAEDVAEYAVALLIDVLRRISASNRFVCAGSWPHKGDYPLGFKVGGKRIGIVGLGNIGSEVAKRVEAFGCSIAYTSRKQKPTVSFPFYANACELAANSDVLILCCGLTEETRHIINKDVLAALGKDGVIINIGRGSLIDEKELVQFLVKGEIGGAGLDVFENEPVVPKELFELDNVVLSPHHGAATTDSFEAVKNLVLSNLLAFFSNKPLRSVVMLE